MTIALCLFVIGILRVDYIWLGNSVGEKSITESVQSLLLLYTVFTFYTLVRKGVLTSAMTLVGGFFCVVLIREFDAFFDQIIHGFWIYPALMVAVSSVVLALRGKNAYLQMGELLENRNMQIIVTSVVILLVFSRFYGIGWFWKDVMSDSYIRDVKNISEETMELLCYGFIALYTYKTKNSLLKN